MSTPEHALLVALDIVDFTGRCQPGGKRPMDDHLDLQQGLKQAFHAACERANLAPAESDIADRGDGMHVLFADPLEPARLVADLPRELVTALEPFNRRREQVNRLRIRVAVHDGYVRRLPMPWQGDSIIKLVRLLDCPQAGAQLREHPEQALALTISDSIYQAAVEEQQRGLKPEQFEPITVQHDDRSLPFSAWLRLPVPEQRAAQEISAAGAASRSAVEPPGGPVGGQPGRVGHNNTGNQTLGDGSHILGSTSGDVHIGRHR